MDAWPLHSCTHRSYGESLHRAGTSSVEAYGSLFLVQGAAGTLRAVGGDRAAGHLTCRSCSQ